MKFSNGCWLNKEKMETFGPSEIYYCKQEDQMVQICAPTYPVRHRGDTLGGVNLTIQITSPMPEVIGVKTFHYAGVQCKKPEFQLNIEKSEALKVRETEDSFEITSGTLRLVITKKDFSMTYYRNDELLTKSTGKDLAYVKTDWRGLAYDDGLEHDTYMRQRLCLSVGELVYGFGERFTSFTKNGQTVDIWNDDGGTSTEQSYKNIPFYLSNRGYGVFVNHPEKVSFEVASETVNKVQFSVEGESLEYFLFNGPTMKETIMRYTDLTGKPALVAPWTFGLWLSTSFTTQYDEVTVNSFVDGMFERDIPLRVFHFDCFWMKEFCWSNFVWDQRVFPDPEGMLKRLKEKGLKICVWINPYIAQESCLFEEGASKGYFIKRKNGDVWQWDMWQPGMAIVDFTNPDACSWFKEKLGVLMDMGVDCFKTDFGERIPTDVMYYDGSDPKKMHNYYTFLYNKTVYDLIIEKRGKKEAVLFARSATVGGQQFPVHWGGDCWSDYESMEESLRGGLSLTMSGFGYWSHDIGGFEHTSTPDVYKRWAAFGLLSSHSRLHGSTSYRVPWVYDEEAVAVVSFFTKLKMSLMPYLYRYAVMAAQTGIPMMRSMVLEFTDDLNCNFLDKQYMLGDSILVAPIFNDQSMGIYYLPEGTWTNYFTGEEKTGGKWVKEHHDYLSIPMMVKENSIIAIGSRQDIPDYDYEKEVTFKAYCLTEGKTSTAVVYSQDTEKKITIEICKKAEQILIQAESQEDFTVVFVNVTNISEVENGELVKEGSNSIVKITKNTKQVVCQLQN
ncbi:alpha-xylosidase [Anaeromicropila populeti]|uniref:alpha-D-xyloside xylohydrolase n=1 Tax=Anaeromicropila populeti TaxID=37658 RepID=A0A1I6J9D9_9FIRM|nr:alpha-xylosidase [Anaeromicropila populeti]SFR75603.1 alpha-D-xyloside xylohydrolase [Anaeromicropila populeti]